MKPNRLNTSFLPVVMVFLVLVPALVASGTKLQAQEPVVNAEVQVGYQPGLSPGDLIEIISPDLTEASDLKLTIGPDGSIYFPYVGTLTLAGLTPEQARVLITKSLKDKQIVNAPQVTMNIIAGRNYSVTVLGEVKAPGRFPAFSPQPLGMILTNAGGFTALASMHVLITHPDGSAPIDVDVSRDLHDLHTLNAQVNPGDVIAVVPAGTFFALGELGHAGTFPIVGTQHMTLLQAIATAGGPTPNAGLSKCRILRTVDGHREELVFDLLKLQRGQIADPLIHTDDIIYVPRNNNKPLINNWLATALTLAAVGLSVSSL